MLIGPHKKAEAAPCGTASFLLQHMVDELNHTLSRIVSRSSLISGMELPPSVSIQHSSFSSSWSYRASRNQQRL
jgi:hypothetical protein